MDTKAKILVVDDDKEIADLVEIHLVSEGYVVRKANDAVTGLAMLKADEDISLAILDIMMPGMDGLSMVKKIRETNNIPIIMLSAKSTDLDKIVGLGNGADDYVTKPFNPLEDLQSLTQRKRVAVPQMMKSSKLDRFISIKAQEKSGHTIKRQSLRLLSTTYSAFLQVIREGYSLLMIYLQGYGMRRHLKATTQLWFTSED